LIMGVTRATVRSLHRLAKPVGVARMYKPQARKLILKATV
jgi:hypothetical protein